MILRDKLTKQIWYREELWDLHVVLSPNKFDDFLVLRRQLESVHGDGTPAVDMIMIDAHNDEFYPATRRVNAIMKRRVATREELGNTREALAKYWLRCFPDDLRIYGDDGLA